MRGASKAGMSLCPTNTPPIFSPTIHPHLLVLQNGLLPPVRPVQQVCANGPFNVDMDSWKDTESGGDDGDENDGTGRLSR